MSSIQLFDVEPDLARFLSEEDRDAVRRLRMPLLEVPPGEFSLRASLEPLQAFGALVIDGLLLQSMRLGEHDGLRLVGPGDVLSLGGVGSSMLVLDQDLRATAPSRLAILGREFLLASRRWPWLIAGLHTRSGEQADRLLTQAMICQLPRVDDRLLSMLWLLAESWGQVISSGTLLPIELTHSVLGGLIGARRPTVTLALRDLTEQGALVRHCCGWLLLQRPSAPPPGEPKPPDEPRLLGAEHSPWVPGPLSETDRWVAGDLERAEVARELQRLSAEHSVHVEQMRENLEAMAAARDAVVQRRREISCAEPPGRRPGPAPSS